GVGLAGQPPSSRSGRPSSTEASPQQVNQGTMPNLPGLFHFVYNPPNCTSVWFPCWASVAADWFTLRDREDEHADHASARDSPLADDRRDRDGGFARWPRPRATRAFHRRVAPRGGRGGLRQRQVAHRWDPGGHRYAPARW